MHVLRRRIVELINEKQLKSQDGEHAEELWSILEVSTVLEDVTEDNDLVQDDQQGQKDCCLRALCLADLVEEVLFKIFLLKLEKVLGSLNDVVDLVVCSVLDNHSVVEIKVIIKAKDVHVAFVNEI